MSTLSAFPSGKASIPGAKLVSGCFPRRPIRRRCHRSGRASGAQVRVILAIAGSYGLKRREVAELLMRRFRVSRPGRLGARQARKLIDILNDRRARK